MSDRARSSVSDCNLDIGQIPTCPGSKGLDVGHFGIYMTSPHRQCPEFAKIAAAAAATTTTRTRLCASGYSTTDKISSRLEKERVDAHNLRSILKRPDSPKRDVRSM